MENALNQKLRQLNKLTHLVIRQRLIGNGAKGQELSVSRGKENEVMQ